MDPLTIARLFATALDRCDYDEATRHVGAGCRYQISGQELVGPEAIIASYRESAEWGRRVLDQVVYESEVQQAGDHVAVLYIDRLTHHGETHVYRCRQRLWLDSAGRIVRIVHEELPGEREKLDAFFVKQGIKR